MLALPTRAQRVHSLARWWARAAPLSTSCTLIRRLLFLQAEPLSWMEALHPLGRASDTDWWLEAVLPGGPRLRGLKFLSGGLRPSILVTSFYLRPT